MHPLLGCRHVLYVDGRPLPGHEPPEGAPWIKADRVYRVRMCSKTLGEIEVQ